MKMMRNYLCLLLTAWMSVAVAQMPERSPLSVNYTDRESGATISGTDIGRFQEGEPNVIIVPDGTDDSVVCRFRSAAGNCYRLSINDGRGHVPVVLIDRASFDNWGVALRGREGWGICEIIENPWGPWEVVGSIPTDPGTHTYTEQRTCSTGGLAEACSNTCPEATQTRSEVVTNPDLCIDVTWGPNPNNYYVSDSFTQTSNCGNTQVVSGTTPDPVSCINTAWSPGTDWYAKGTSFYQTSNCGDSRASVGTWEPAPSACDATTWTGPNPATYYTDETNVHTNACGDTMSVAGTMTRPQSPTEPAPTPDPTTAFTDPTPTAPLCIPTPGVYGGEIYFGFVYASGWPNGNSGGTGGDFSVGVSGNSYEELVSNADAIINSYTTDNVMVTGWSDQSVPGTTCP